MRMIDKMLVKAKSMIQSLFAGLYDFNEDGFIESLGLNPKDYEVMVDNESMYDSMKALSDSCKMIWGTIDVDERGTCRTNSEWD